MFSDRVKTVILGLLLLPALAGCGTQPVAADVSAEFPISAYSELMLVPVTIRAGEHLCVVDSGAGGYIFHTTLRHKLGASLGQTPIVLPDGTIAQAEEFNVPDARIGPIKLDKDAPTVSFDLSSLREMDGRDIDGLIGLPLFQSYIVQMDFDARRIVISSPSISPEPTWGEPIRLSYNDAKLPTVLVEFGDGISERCVVDTGYDGFIWLSSKLYAELLNKERVFAGGEIPLSHATGYLTVHEGIAPFVKIGSFENKDVPVLDGGAESRIGLEFLRRFRVTMDIPHNRIYLTKGADFGKPNKPRAVGIALRRKNEKTVVTFVEPDSPAADAGISVNDELVTIAGEPIAGRPLAEIKWMLREKADPRGKLKLLLRRENQERKVDLTIRDPSYDGPRETAYGGNKEQAAAVAEIRRLGGDVTFDEKAPGKPVFAVDLSETDIRDDDLRVLEGLPELKALLLVDTQVTDEGMKHIEGLTQLRRLALFDTQLGDAGLEHIKPLIDLEYLDLDDTQVTDEGLKHIGGLAKLHLLSLANTRVTDEGLKHLKGLKELRALYIWRTQVTPAGLKELKQALPNLEVDDPEDNGEEP